MQVNIGGREVQVELQDKPAIEFSGLRELAKRFFDAVVEEPCRQVCVASLRDYQDENMPDPSGLVEFNWAKNFGQGMSLEELQACEWCNNLDSLIDYSDPVNMTPVIAFAALECARQGRSVFLESKDGLDLVWFGEP